MFIKRILKRIQIVGLLIGGAIGFLIGIILKTNTGTIQTNYPKVIRAQKFELVDDKGNPLADFNSLKWGNKLIGVNLSLSNKKGEFSFFSSNDVSIFEMRNKQNRTGIGLEVVNSGKDGSPPEIIVIGKKTRTSISFKANGNPDISAMDNVTNRMWEVPFKEIKNNQSILQPQSMMGRVDKKR